MAIERAIDITPAQKKVIIDLLDCYLPHTTAWVYGSRVKWTARPNSDLDMVVFTQQDQQSQVSNLREALAESDLPFKVDLFVWDDVPVEFRQNIEAEYVVVRERGDRYLPEHWSVEKLEDCMDAIIDYRGKTPKKINSGIPLITAKIIKNGRIETAKEFISEDDYDSWMTRGIPEDSDVVMTTEAPLGEVAQLDNRKVALAQRVITLRGKRGLLDNGFLKYLIISQYVQNQLDGRGTGTTVKGIKQSELRQITLKFPPLPQQKAIAHILGSLDDKIELNRQMNATLEAMAQGLFKSWFVDFDPVMDNALAAGNTIPEAFAERAERRLAAQRLSNDGALSLGGDQVNDDLQAQFPSEFEWTEEMGWVPKGWGVKTMESLIDIIGGGTPKTGKREYWDGEIPWFSVVDSPDKTDIFVIDTEKHITELAVKESSTKILPVGTTIISARGTVGKCAMVGTPMAMNQSCYGIRGKDNISNTFIYFAVIQNIADLQRNSHGSVFSTITRGTFKTLTLAFGGEYLSIEFDQKVKSFFDKVLENNIQKKSLENLRDTLLPKLLSGEVRIPEAEQLIEAA